MDYLYSFSRHVVSPSDVHTSGNSRCCHHNENLVTRRHPCPFFADGWWRMAVGGHFCRVAEDLRHPTLILVKKAMVGGEVCLPDCDGARGCVLPQTHVPSSSISTKIRHLCKSCAHPPLHRMDSHRSVLTHVPPGNLAYRWSRPVQNWHVVGLRDSDSS